MIGRRERPEPLVDHRHQLAGDEGAPFRIARVFLLPIGRLREHRDHRRDGLVRDQMIEHARHVHLLDVVARRRAHRPPGRARPLRPRNRAAGRTRPAACRRAIASRSSPRSARPSAPSRAHRPPVARRRTASALRIAAPRTPGRFADSAGRTVYSLSKRNPYSSRALVYDVLSRYDHDVPSIRVVLPIATS